MPNALPPGEVDRFRRDFEILVPPPERIGVAVSGGPDSLALLLLAASAYPDRVEAATIDHGLRPESAAEAIHVAGICARLGIPHSIIPVEVARGGEGLQGEARRARYAALRDWAEERGIGAICTAHHADDQAETILMRLQRGAGLSGLSGVRPVRPQGERLLIVRPLLGWTRAELAQVVERSGVPAVDDPSNHDLRFNRVTMRRFLESNPDFDPLRLTRSARAIGEADEALDWAVQEIWSSRVREEAGKLLFNPAGLPTELLRRMLVRILATFGGPPPRGEEVQSLAVRLTSGQTATLAEVKCTGGADWRFEHAPPRRTR